MKIKKEIKRKKDKLSAIWGFFLLVLFTIFLIIPFVLIGSNNEKGFICKIKNTFSPDEIYCKKIIKCFPPYSNVSNDCWNKWIVGNITQENIEKEQRKEAEKERQRQEEAIQICYDSGSDYFRSFDIIEDYSFTCPKLAYINNHLIDKIETRDGGYISGSSSGSVSGQFNDYVTERVSVTGMLVQNISYHLNCNEEISDEVIDYYDEAEFVLYYVERCIK